MGEGVYEGSSLCYIKFLCGHDDKTKEQLNSFFRLDFGEGEDWQGRSIGSGCHRYRSKAVAESRRLFQLFSAGECLR